MSIAGEGGRGREEEDEEEEVEEEVEGGRGGAGRGLSYSLPVTYYELIPTAPVKYYCKILTVICARERNAGTLRARVCPRQLTRRANELPRRAFAFFVRPSISFRNLFRSPTPGNVETWRRPPPLGLLRALCCPTTTTITDVRES